MLRYIKAKLVSQSISRYILYHVPSEKWAICCSSPRSYFRMGRTGIEALLSLLSKYMQEMTSLFKVIVSNLFVLILIYTPKVS